LRRHHLPAEFLTLEITESIVITDADRALGCWPSCVHSGFGWHSTTSGTGYSSLTYFVGPAIQQLKIDRSFVTAILESSRDAAIVTSLIDLAHHLGLEVIAEGVEDEVVALGCGGSVASTGRAFTSRTRWTRRCYRPGRWPRPPSRRRPVCVRA